MPTQCNSQAECVLTPTKQFDFSESNKSTDEQARRILKAYLLQILMELCLNKSQLTETSQHRGFGNMVISQMLSILN